MVRHKKEFMKNTQRLSDELTRNKFNQSKILQKINVELYKIFKEEKFSKEYFKKVEEKKLVLKNLNTINKEIVKLILIRDEFVFSAS